MSATTALVFEAPGPGTWTLDPVHFPRPVTKYWTEIHPPAFARGVADFTSYYGMLLDRLEDAYVNGIAYMAMVPVSEQEVPVRIARAGEVFEGKLWREQLRNWDEDVKPAAVAKHRELLSVDPDALSDDELVAYLHRCRDHHSAMITQHMRFTAAAVVPTGDFLAHVSDWTDYSHSQLLDLLQGSAPVSAGASGELDTLVKGLRKDPATRDRLAGAEDAGAAIRAVQDGGGEIGKAMSAYIGLVGYRILDGFDIAEPCAIELPDVLLRSILSAVEGTAAELVDADDRIAEIRGAVPADHRDEFELVAGGGQADLPNSRRARRVQRHMGIRHHAPRRAFGWSPACAKGPRRRSGTSGGCRDRGNGGSPRRGFATLRS